MRSGPRMNKRTSRKGSFVRDVSRDNFRCNIFKIKQKLFDKSLTLKIFNSRDLQIDPP